MALRTSLIKYIRSGHAMTIYTSEWENCCSKASPTQNLANLQVPPNWMLSLTTMNLDINQQKLARKNLVQNPLIVSDLSQYLDILWRPQRRFIILARCNNVGSWTCNTHTTSPCKLPVQGHFMWTMELL